MCDAVDQSRCAGIDWPSNIEALDLGGEERMEWLDFDHCDLLPVVLSGRLIGDIVAAD